MRMTLATVGAVAVSAALAACGSSTNGSSTKQAGSPPSSSSSSGAPAYGPSGGGSPASPGPSSGSIGARKTSLGTFIVDAQGRSLYLFVKDRSAKSSCYGACASVWPPVTTAGGAKAGSGVQASLLGTSRRTDGKTQLTYGGHPLYLYAEDQSAGATRGESLNQFGAKWYLLRPSGRKLDHD